MTGFNYLKDNPLIQQSQQAGANAFSGLSGALGFGGPEGQDESFQRFMDSMGYQSQLRAGQEAVSSSAAARGMLNSGSTLRRLQEVGQGLAQQGYGQYLTNLYNLAGMGQQSALGVGSAGTAGGSSAAANQPQNTGILGRFFGI